MATFLNDDDIDFDAYLSATDSDAKVKKAAVWAEEFEAELLSPPIDRSVSMPWGSTVDSFAFPTG